jgi:hypothetical protein
MNSPEMLEEVRGLSSQDLQDIRELFKNDLYFACKGILGYDQLQEEAHRPLCDYLMYDQSMRKMVLMPRGHLKSTICTIGRPIQLAVRDPDHYRGCIENENATKASAFLDEIKQHWVKNEVLRSLFPELIPEKFAGPGSDWSQASASLRRNAVFKESTWTTLGAGGSGVGWHFSHIIPDDLIGEQHKNSPADMERVKIWNRGQEALLDDQDRNEICWVGTRKTISDLYADVMEIYEGELSLFIREPIEDGKVIFPLKFSMQRFERMMEKTPEEWAHDYMNNPVGKGGRDWANVTLQDWRLADDGQTYIIKDPDTDAVKKVHRSSLDIVITVDPNSGKPHAPDQASLVVHGVTPEEEILYLETRVGRPSPDGLIDWAFDACMKWKPRVIGIEEAGQQNTLFYFDKKCRKKGIFFNAVPLKHKNQDKERRIRTALDTPLRGRRIFFGPDQLTLKTSIKFFPQLMLHMWDELDAASYGPELYRKGLKVEDQQRKKNNEARILALRGRTGYGRSFRR